MPEIDWTSPVTMGLIAAITFCCYKIAGSSLTELAKGLGLLAFGYLTLRYAGTYVEEAVELISNAFSSKFTAQAGDGSESIASAMCGLLFYVMYNTTPPAKMTSTFVKAIGDLPRFKGGLVEIVDTVLGLLKNFCNWLADSAGLEFLRTINTKNQRVIEIAEGLNQLIKELREGEHYDAAHADRLFAAEAELRAALANTPTTREFAGEIHCIESLLRTISNLAPNFVGYAKNGPRAAPTGILLIGPPGVGKGVNTFPLLSDVLARVLPDDEWEKFVKNPNDCIFNWMMEQEFWEGFHGQQVIVMDEVGQQVDSSGNPDPGLFGYVRLNNTMPDLLNMAHCDSKGNTFARPLICWGTTNLRKFDIKSIVSPEAYTRRWDVVVLQVPKPEFCKLPPEPDEFETGAIWKRRLDHSKLPRDAAGVEELTLDISEFYLYDIDRGAPLTRTPLTYPQCDDTDPAYERSIVKHIADVVRKKRAKGTRMLEFQKFHREELDRKRRAGALMMPQAGDFNITEWANRLAFTFNVELEKVQNTIKRHHMGARTTVRQFWSAFKVDWIYPHLDTLETVKNTFISHLTGIAAIGITLGVIGFFKFSWKVTSSLFLGQSGGGHRGVPKVAVVARPRTGVMKPQGPRTTLNDRDMCDFLFKYCIYELTVEVEGADEFTKFGYVIMIGGRVGLTLKHFYDKTKHYYADHYRGVKWRFRRIGSDVGFSVPFSWFEEVDAEGQHTHITRFEQDAEDIMWFTLPEAQFMHKNVLHFLRSETDRFFQAPFHMNLFRFAEDRYDTHGAPCEPVKYEGDYAYGYSFPVAFAYAIKTEEGECGAPCIITDSKNKKPTMFAMHVAGSGTHGMGVPITIESAKAALIRFGYPKTQPLTEEDCKFKEQCGMPGKFIVKGPRKPVSQSSKTQIMKAPLHGLMGPVTKKPAQLRPDGYVDVLSKTREKYMKETYAVNEDLWAYAERYTGDHVLKTIPGSVRPPPRVWTFEEALLGCDGFGGVSLSTSAGYPWNLEFKKKRDWVTNKSGEIDLTTKRALRLRAATMELYNWLLTGEGDPPEILFLDMPKDETLPDGKSTRMISIEPFHLTLATRMLFGDFMRNNHENHTKNGMAIGINTYSWDWEFLARTLRKVGDNMVAGDHSGYDGRFTVRLWYTCARIANRYYYNATEQEKAARIRYADRLSNTCHVTHVRCPDGTDQFIEYEMVGTMSSGVSVTADFGSIGGLVIDRYAVYMVLMDPGPKTHLDFKHGDLDFDWIEKNFVPVQGGDDNILSIGDPLLINGVDQTALTDAFARLGWKYTDELKGDGTHTTRPLSAIMFYKRWFLDCILTGRKACPLEFDSIDDRLNWIKETAFPGDYERNVRSAVHEYAQWGPSVFYDRGHKLIRLAEEKLQIMDLPRVWEQAMMESASLKDYVL